jgi:cell division protease FtsH
VRYGPGAKRREASSCDIVKLVLDCDVYVQNNLVHFYGACKKIKDALRVFDEMSERTIVSWNAVLTAYIDNLRLNDGMEYFVKMRDCGFELDETTMVVVLNASSKLGNWVHSYVIVRGLVLNCQLGTALVDMYAKAGALGYARLCRMN